MREKKKWILFATIVVVCATVFVFSGYLIEMSAIPAEEDFVLSNVPNLFEKEVVIVIGENATQIENESAEAIAEHLFNSTGTMPLLITDTELVEEEIAENNLIVVGTPRTNRMLEEVYAKTNATRVTDEYPGEGKGILEILRNPWNEDKAMLLVVQERSRVKSSWT